MNEFYDELIGYLKRKKPSSLAPEGLTEKIMLAVQKNRCRNRPFISLAANEKQWNLYRIFRIITTTAAAFLIVLLIREQWEMNRKLDRLESELVSSHNIQGHNKYTSRSEKIQYLLYDLQEDSVVISREMDNREVLRINRKSLNFLLNRIRELETENMSFRTKILQQYSDSTQFIQK